MQLLSLLFLSAAFAYIPEYKMILSRVADNHGRGVYQIEQDVVFRSGTESWTAKETWWIKDENTMRVQVEGRGALKGLLQYQAIYENGQKTIISADGSVKHGRIAGDWPESIFTFRHSKIMRQKLVNEKVTPAESMRDLPLRLPNKEVPSQSFLRLSRTGGVVNYAIGSPTPTNDNNLRPGVWIEQDQFLVRKIRFPSQLTVTADQYQRFDNGLWFPKIRNYNWGDNSVQAQVSDVRTSKVGSEFFSANKLTTTWTMKVPDQPLVQDFYSRFR